jgi:fatty-acid desaturase
MSGRVEHAPVNWVTAIVFTITPLAALIFVPWYGFAHGYSLSAWVSFVLILAATGMSITSGYHRLWAHRTYQAHWLVRLIYMIFGTMALQNSVLIWASQHRMHHRFVDDVDRDPYSAKRGFWFSHIGWILRNYPSGEPDFTNAKDLERDPMVMFQHRFYVPLAVGLNFAMPLAIGLAVGDPIGVFLLAGLLRLVVNHHFTFFINSLAHMWGSQAVYGRELGTRQRGARADHLWRGVPQLPPHLPERLPQWRSLVAVRPEQVADFRPVLGGAYERPEARSGHVDPACAARHAVQAHGARDGEEACSPTGRALRAAEGACRRGSRRLSARLSRSGLASAMNGSATASGVCC